MGFSIQIAGGSAIGRSHNIAGRGCQDAYGWGQTGDGVIAVVCDGCGSSAHAEVGAKLAVRWTVRAIGARLGQGLPVQKLLEEVRQELLSRMYQLALDLGAEPGPFWAPQTQRLFARAVEEYLLFTIVGVMITGKRTTTFSIGDGLVAVNGERRRLGPFPKNRPPFLGYALMPEGDQGRAGRGFKVHDSIPTQALRSVLIGTDGAAQIDEQARSFLPGSEEPVGPLDQFWTEDYLFTKPGRLGRRLKMIQRGPNGGLLGDDVSMVVIRRAG